MSVYQTSAIKRSRRTNNQLDSLLAACNSILAEQSGQISIRHLFYRLVGAKAIEKTEKEYGRLCNHLAKWRRAGAIEWGAFVDSTRWHYGSTLNATLDEALTNTVTAYRKNLWADQSAYVEVWCEKDACASILLDAADPFGVKVFVCRGFPSLSSLHSASETFKAAIRRGKSPTIYYFGDRDPSGIAIDGAVTKTLGDDFGVVVEFCRVAVTPEQIAEFSLPTRPTKKTDSRARNFLGESVELDAMPPDALREIARDRITQHIDAETWSALQRTETMEKESWTKFMKGRKAT